MLRLIISPLLHIRKSILQVTQTEMANVAGVKQATVSRWETGHLEPSRQEMSAIRDEVRRRGIDWDDRWLFDNPVAVVESVEAAE